jgi:hypothetical protein
MNNHAERWVSKNATARGELSIKEKGVSQRWQGKKSL